MKDKMFCVTSDSGRVNEYFDERDSAIAFVVDEFAMTLIFRNDKEGECLYEYMKTHSETPNQYPYKYFIKEVAINHDYDKPKSIWLIALNETSMGVENEKQYIFVDYNDARKEFDKLIKEDTERFGEDNKTKSVVDEWEYYRWDSENGSLINHLHLQLKEYTTSGNKFEEKRPSK